MLVGTIILRDVHKEGGGAYIFFDEVYVKFNQKNVFREDVFFDLLEERYYVQQHSDYHQHNEILFVLE
jgi:hypothetical protein